MLKCKRCNHEWYPKNNEEKPQVCPRCKSTQWGKEKIRSWEKVGKLYVVLLKDGIKVGQAVIPERRTGNLPGKQKKYYSDNCKDINKFEKLLIKQTTKICGKATRGREYFKGGEQEYNEIVLYLKTVGNKTLTGKKTHNENIADYDLSVFLKDSITETFLKIVLQERKNCLETIGEAIEDAQNNKCSYRKALFSLNGILTNLVVSASEKLNEL